MKLELDRTTTLALVSAAMIVAMSSMEATGQEQPAYFQLLFAIDHVKQRARSVRAATLIN